MLTSYAAVLSIHTQSEVHALKSHLPFAPPDDEVDWREIAIALDHCFRFVCLVMLDQGSASTKFQEGLQTQYLDIDRITGPDILVLSTVPPPPKWYAHKLAELQEMPEFAHRFIGKSIHMLEKTSGQEQAALNSQRLISQFFEPQSDFPALVFVWANSLELEALSFDISAMTSNDSVRELFLTLRQAADQLTKNPTVTTSELAEKAFSAWNPFSLRWKNAVLKSVDILTFVQKWKEFAEQLGGAL